MNTIKRLFALVLCTLILFAFSSCGKEEEAEPTSLPENFQRSEEVTDLVCIQMDTGKYIVVELYPDIAPITVENFQKLVKEDFYDGLIFHRVVKDFMIQGGCPKGNGTGDPGWSIKGEFSSNGVENDLKHTRGVLSMARGEDPDSAGSQFFIMHKIAPHLDGNYAAFGKVVSGIDVVDEIACTLVAGETPVAKQVMKEVFFVTDSNRANGNETTENQTVTAET